MGSREPMKDFNSVSRNLVYFFFFFISNREPAKVFMKEDVIINLFRSITLAAYGRERYTFM